MFVIAVQVYAKTRAKKHLTTEKKAKPQRYKERKEEEVLAADRLR
jgi:hypothetical protein